MATVTIDNVGPIEHLDIDVPENGGVVVLRGHNGAGKSIALDATRRLLGGKTKPPVADDAPKGKIAGFGARINVANRITQSGTLEATSIEGSFDLAALVDPGIQDPDAADAKRIKALLSLLELDADPTLFYELTEGEAGYLQLGIEETDDVVVMAKRIKSKLESRAREQESVADKLVGESSAMLKDVTEYPPEVCRDVDGLQGDLEAAVAHKSKLTAQRDTAIADQKARNEAMAKLEELPKVEIAAAEVAVERCEKQVEKLEQEAEAIAKKLREACFHRDRAQQHLDAEAKRAKDCDTYLDVINAVAAQPEPTPEEFEHIEQELSRCRNAIEQATLARAADQKAAAANAKRKEAETARDAADRFREAARSTDDVLSGAVAKLDVGLKVVAGRLCTETNRGNTPLSELSHGERWKIAVDLGVKRVGENGVLAIPQESWESLDPSNRELVSNHALKRRVVILTAEAADGGLRSEVLN